MNPTIHVATSKIMGFEWQVIGPDGSTALAIGHEETARAARSAAAGWIEHRYQKPKAPTGQWITPDGVMREIKG